MGPSGNTWELVIESPEAGAIAYTPAARPEMTRRNASMNIADTSARLATDLWPEAPRPSLRHDRRISLPRDEGTYLYFGSAREWERRTYRWRGGY